MSKLMSIVESIKAPPYWTAIPLSFDLDTKCPFLYFGPPYLKGDTSPPTSPRPLWGVQLQPTQYKTFTWERDDGLLFSLVSILEHHLIYDKETFENVQSNFFRRVICPPGEWSYSIDEHCALREHFCQKPAVTAAEKARMAQIYTSAFTEGQFLDYTVAHSEYDLPVVDCFALLDRIVPHRPVPQTFGAVMRQVRDMRRLLLAMEHKNRFRF
jgi:hypothetical protein